MANSALLQITACPPEVLKGAFLCLKEIEGAGYLHGLLRDLSMELCTIQAGSPQMKLVSALDVIHQLEDSFSSRC